MRVLQEWVEELSIMQQSVLMAAVRAPDGMCKNHPVKVLTRWYRRCILHSAFDGKVLDNPYTPGGGSFTGPFTESHQREFRVENFTRPSDNEKNWRDRDVVTAK